MRVEDEPIRALLQHPAVIVSPETSLRDLAAILAEESIGAALVRRSVVVEGAGSHPDGLVSERDISRAIAAGLDPDATMASDVMTLDLAYAAPGETILRVAQRMLANEIRHVPISDNGVVIGVLSERDVLRAFLQEVQEQMN